MIEKKEIKFLILWSSFIIGILFVPYLYGWLVTPPNKVFLHLASHIYPEDTNTYFAWINQASQGHFLFEDLYTSTPHGRTFFQPLFLLMGLVTRFLHVPIIFLWYFGQIIVNLFLCFSLYFFISYFVKNKVQRKLAFVLATTSAGFGWIFGFASADTWMPELTLFQSMGWPFLFSLAIALMLWIFLFFLRALGQRKFRYIFYAGSLTLLLTFIHPYDVATVYGVLGIYTLYLIFNSRKFAYHLKRIFVFLLISLPAPLYNFYLVSSNPVFGGWNEQSKTLSPPLYSYLLGFGLLIPLAIWGIAKIAKAKNEKFYFLLLWLPLAFVLVYLPLNFQRRLIMGVQIPLVILASIPLMKLLKCGGSGRNVRRPLDVVRLPRIMLLAYLFLILSATNINLMGNFFLFLKTGDYPWYIEKKVIEATEWLKEHSKAEEVVFSSYNIGNLIPRLSGSKAFIGHWSLTDGVAEKQEDVSKFFSSSYRNWSETEAMLSKNKIKYIFLSPYENAQGSLELISRSLSASMVKVFDNGFVKIFKTKTRP